MESFRYGASIRLRVYTRDSITRELVDLPSAPSGVATKPDDTTTALSFARSALGTYDATVTPAENEQGVWRWSATAAQGAESSYFLVRD